MPSLRLVKPFMSQNSTVITRRSPSLGGQRLPLDQALDDARVDIAAEGFAQAFLVAQLLDHVVERRRELADLVARSDVDRAIEPAGFDGAGAVQQAPHRAGYSGADKK
jgi:hypothetical protein